MKTYRNNRNEIASTDGTRWWAGDCSDETSIKLSLLQPASALIPEYDDSTSSETMRKARSVFVSALMRVAPKVAPSSDGEKDVLRAAWDDAQAFSESKLLKVQKVGVPVFSCKLDVVGTADAIVCDCDGNVYPYVYWPRGFTHGGAMSAMVRILYCGLPIKCADDQFGTYKLSDLAYAVQALVTRDSTEWFAANMRGLPF